MMKPLSWSWISLVGLLLQMNHLALAQDTALCANNRERIERLEKDLNSAKGKDRHSLQSSIKFHCGRMNELLCPNIPGICSGKPSAKTSAATNVCKDGSGSWQQNNQYCNSSTWKLTGGPTSGTAKESGCDNATGDWTLTDDTLTVNWSFTKGEKDEWKGNYSWKLDASCKKGAGPLTFTQAPNHQELLNKKDEEKPQSTVEKK